MGLALVGCREGDVVDWVFESGVKKIEIIKVERLPN
jgi:transcription elongation GreA/GreB family factor